MTESMDMRNAHVVKLGDAHWDMRRYLQNDCYCPGEIYDQGGFSFIAYDADDDCVVVEQNEDMSVVVCPRPSSSSDYDSSDWSNAQVILFWHDDVDGDNPEHRIVDATRFDATDNNVGILCTIANGGKPDGRKIDEYQPGSHASSMRKLMSMCDAVIVD